MIYNDLHTQELLDMNKEHRDLFTKSAAKLIHYVGHYLFVKPVFHPVEAEAKHKAHVLIKKGIDPNEIVKEIVYLLLTSGSLSKYQEAGMGIKTYLSHGINNQLTYIQERGLRGRIEAASIKKEPLTQVKTKSGRMVGTMAEYLEQTLPPEPKVKTEEEENEERLLFFLGV
jgi:hypothetical protein